MRIVILSVLLAVVSAATVSASSVYLGTASSFGLLGGTISNTGASMVIGDVGATTTITGFPPGTATGTIYPAPSDPTVALAYNDFITAFNLAELDPSTQSFTDLTTSQTFVGNNLYTSSLTDVVSTAGINLTFDAQGDSTEVFIVRITRDLTINGPITFTLDNGALAANIFWIIGRTATIDPVGVPIDWEGSILAGTSFTMSSIGPSSALGGTIHGCAFAETANTLAGNTQVNGCSTAGASGTVPEPGTFGLLALGGLLAILTLRGIKTPILQRVSRAISSSTTRSARA